MCKTHTLGASIYILNDGLIRFHKSKYKEHSYNKLILYLILLYISDQLNEF